MSFWNRERPRGGNAEAEAEFDPEMTQMTEPGQPLRTPGADEFERRIGSFRLSRLLGEGSAASVWVGERTDFRQCVAIKLFHGPAPDGEQRGLEPRLPAEFDHPHIARLLDRGVTEDREPYLVLELVEGEPLDRYADGHTLSIAKRIELARTLLDALGYAHSHLVLHCDLKPANVLVSADGELKLIDFGSSVQARERSTSYTVVYASPEALRGERLSVATDLFSVGLLCRTLFAGLTPETNRAETMSSSLGRLPAPQREALAQRRGLSAGRLRKTLRGDLDAIVQKALSDLPDDRYQTAEAFDDDLRRVLDHAPVAARSTPALELLEKWISRHAFFAVAAAVLLLALLLSSAGVMWQAARAERERKAAELRLEDLVRMTGMLQSELYDTVRVLPNASAAEDSLMSASAATLDGIAATGTQDRNLEAHLARQYASLAELAEARSAAISEPERSHFRQQGIAYMKRALQVDPPQDPQRATLLARQDVLQRQR
jgi:hypothetical protein